MYMCKAILATLLWLLVTHAAKTYAAFFIVK